MPPKYPPMTTSISESSDNPEPDTRGSGAFEERSATGTQFFSGYIRNEEYLSELEGLSGIDVFDRMRRSDAQVRGTLLAIQLPIRQAQWTVEPASDDAADKEIAETVQNNLLKDMSITWDDFLRQALSYLTFGHAVFEEVYELRDGFIVLKKLAPRIQKTIWKWFRNEKGEFSKIQQHVQMPDTNQFEYRDIEAERLTVFTNEQEGDNYMGISVLRSAYKHWYIKDNLYKVDAIGHDRFASGVPWLKEPVGSNTTDVSRAKSILADLHSRERSYVVIPNGWEFGILERAAGANSGVLDSIKYHDEAISKNILAQFINLGTTETGSRALSESFVEMFLMSLNAVAGYICDVMNRKVIRQLVDYNWDVDEYPKLTCSRITLSNLSTVLGLSDSIQKGGITKTVDVENHIRGIAGLQPLTEQSTASAYTAPDSAEVKAHEHKGPCACLSDKKKKRARKLSDCEVALADFDAIEKHLDDGLDHYKAQIMKVRLQQIEKMSKDILTVKPTELKAAYVGKLADRIYDEMLRAYKRGSRDIEDELIRQAQKGKIKLAERKKKAPDLKDYSSEDDIISYMKQKAEADAVGMSSKLSASALNIYYALPSGMSSDEKTAAVYSSLADMTQDVNQYASGSVNVSYGLGRDYGASEYGEDIEYSVYSAVLDGNTCDNCLAKDGVQHTLSDTEFDTPNAECEGTASRCRCVNIYKLAGMEGDFVTKPKEDYMRDLERIERGQYGVGDAREKYGM